MPVEFLPAPNETAAAAVRIGAYADLHPEITGRAYAVAGIEDMKALHRVREAVAKVPEGGDWREAREEIAAELGDPEKTRAHAETVLRTNCFEAYAAARWRRHQADRDVMPYLVYHCVGDDRVRPEHRALDGTVLPVDDPFWETHYPPWDWGCRCVVSGMTQLEHDEEMADPDSAFKFPTPEQARRVPNAPDFSFNPKTLSVDLDDLNGREYADDASMRDFSGKMRGRFVDHPDGSRESVWDWLVRNQLERDAGRLRVGIDEKDAPEIVVIRDADTGRKVFERKGTADEIDGPEADALYRAEAKLGHALVAIHRHPGDAEAVPSPEDVLMAVKKASERQCVVSDFGTSTLSIDKSRRFNMPEQTERELEEMLRRYRAREISRNEWENWLLNQPWIRYKIDRDGMGGLRP